jgi:hypothetical protein
MSERGELLEVVIGNNVVDAHNDVNDNFIR